MWGQHPRAVCDLQPQADNVGDSEQMNIADAKSQCQENWETGLEQNHTFPAKAFQLHSLQSGKTIKLEVKRERVVF